MSKKLKLTRLFPGDVKPARPGVYQRKNFQKYFYAKWTGKEWMAYSSNKTMADCAKLDTIFPNLPWRGLAVKP